MPVDVYALLMMEDIVQCIVNHTRYDGIFFEDDRDVSRLVCEGRQREDSNILVMSEECYYTQ